MNARCGTEWGIAQHKHANEPPCRFCKKLMDEMGVSVSQVGKMSAQERQERTRELNRLRQAERRKRLREAEGDDKPKQKARMAGPGEERNSNGTRVVQCGEPGGEQRHRRRGEPICDECREAMRVWRANDRAEKRANGTIRQKVARCGTASGSRRHRRNGEQVCEPCRLAHLEYNRMKAAEAKERKKNEDQREEGGGNAAVNARPDVDVARGAGVGGQLQLSGAVV